MRTKMMALVFLAVTAGVFAYTRPHESIPSDFRDAVADNGFDTSIPVIEKEKWNIQIPKAAVAAGQPFHRSAQAPPLPEGVSLQQKIHLALEQADKIINEADLNCARLIIDPEIQVIPQNKSSYCPTIDRVKTVINMLEPTLRVKITKDCSTNTNGPYFFARIEGDKILLCEKYAKEASIPDLARVFLHEASHIADYVYHGTNNGPLLECWANEILHFSTLFSGRYPVVTDDYPWRYDCWDFVNRMNQSIIPALKHTPIEAGMAVKISSKVMAAKKIADVDFPLQGCSIDYEMKPAASGFVSGEVISLESFPELPLNRSYAIFTSIRLDLKAFGPGTITCINDFHVWGVEKIREVSKGGIVFSTAGK